MQAELLIQAVEWCRHGHPVLVLRESLGGHRVSIAVTVEDAQDLLPGCPLASGRFRACALALALLDTLGGTIDAVTLTIGADQIMRARLSVAGPLGAGAIEAHATDGLALARQRGLPLLIDAANLARVGEADQHEPGRHTAASRPVGGDAAPGDGRQPADPLAPFRAIVETLDFGEGLATDDGERGC